MPHSGPMAKAGTKKLRWALWHAAGKVTTTGRRSTLHLDVTWPWATTCKKASTASTPLPLHDLTQPTHPAASPSEPPATSTTIVCRHPTNKSALLCRQTDPPRSHGMPDSRRPHLESLKVRNSSVNLVTNSRGWYGVSRNTPQICRKADGWG